MLPRFDLDQADRAWGHVLRRLPDEGPEHDLWTAWDLASLVEGGLGEIIDGRTLDLEARRTWAARLGGDRMGRRAAHDAFSTGYWIVDDGEPIGTLGVWADSARGSDTLFLTSLYVEPARRGRALGAAALDAAFMAATAQGLAGLRLETHWTWQRSLRWYLRRGWWIRNWKHAITLTRRRDWPAYEVRIGADEATFAVGGQVWVQARRAGDRLALPVDAHASEALHASATLATHLACAGWPLIRSDAAWEQRWYSSDVGGPEGLAAKIGIFERVAREQGWRVETPKIPGVDPEAD